MKLLLSYIGLFLIFSGQRLNAQENPIVTNKTSITMDKQSQRFIYPVTRRDTTVVDDYFGEKIADPYRWLEADTSAETKDWVARQNAVTFKYLADIPYRDQIKKRLTEIWNFERYSAPFKEGDAYYFFKNNGLQNQSVLFAQEKLDGNARVVLDPNTFSTDGTASLQEMEFSKSGKYLAYAISRKGSDWRTIQIMEPQTGRLLTDKLEWAKFTTLAWQNDGFYYSRYPEPVPGLEFTAGNENSAVYYHTLGRPQTDDQLIYSDPTHPKRNFSVSTTEDERFILLYGTESTSGNSLAFKDLTKKDGKFVTVVDGFENDYSVIDNLGDKLLVLTNNQASRQRVLLIDTRKPEKQHWQTLIAEDTADVLQNVVLCGGKLLCVYLHNAFSTIRVYDLNGKLLGNIQLPEIGTVSGLNGKKEDNLAFFGFTSFLRPSTVYSLDMNTLQIKIFKAPKIAFNPDDYMTEQVWYHSSDGEKVPMFITRRKDLKKDGKSTGLLYGYGGFNISQTPVFSVSRAVFLEQGGVYAVANLRGGGEFGEEWHKAGTKCRKQNVFNDFITAAEYLRDQGYSHPKRLAIEGGSNGGLLVGAVMTQRPNLFAVALPRVGVLDMLRYHLFTIGHFWATDYGRSDNPEEYKCLRAYSPLHNLNQLAYPATLITTADHDDRVVPAHSFKFAATLQANQQGTAPTLIRIDTSAGHGAGKPTSKLIEESADLLAFIFYNTGAKVKF